MRLEACREVGGPVHGISAGQALLDLRRACLIGGQHDFRSTTVLRSPTKSSSRAFVAEHGMLRYGPFMYGQA